MLDVIISYSELIIIYEANTKFKCLFKQKKYLKRLIDDLEPGLISAKKTVIQMEFYLTV